MILKSPSGIIDHSGYTGPMLAVVGLVYDRETRRVLLGIRTGSHAEGYHQFPGGKVDAWETPDRAIVREGYEEHGLYLPDPIRLPYDSDDRYPGSNRQYWCLYFLQEWNGQEPRVMEPRKCKSWDWYPWDDLPSPMMAPGALLHQRFPDLDVFL